MGPESVIVEVQVLEWDVAGQESNQGRLSVETKGIIVKDDGAQVGKIKDRGEERGESLGDLV